MLDDDTIGQLVEKGTQGDRVALQQLLALHVSDLAKFIARKLPASRQALVDPEDIVQQTYVHELPDDYRQAVEMRLLEGQSLEQTAATMNRSPRAVQGLVDRARKKLRAALVRLSLYE